MSGMPVPVFLHDVERVPSSEFGELLLLADEQLFCSTYTYLFK